MDFVLIQISFGYYLQHFSLRLPLFTILSFESFTINLTEIAIHKINLFQTWKPCPEPFDNLKK